MSKLAKLLDAKEPTFSLAIRDMEKITLEKSTDVLLLSEMMNRAQNRMRKLGLDPADTTAKELHRALENRIASDNIRLAKIIGARMTMK